MRDVSEGPPGRTDDVAAHLMPPLAPQPSQPVARDGGEGAEEMGPGVGAPFVGQERGSEVVQGDGGQDGEMEGAGN